MMSHDWFSAGKNKKCCRFLFPQGMPLLWALFQAGFVFQNIDYKVFLFSSTDSARRSLSVLLFAAASSGYSPELAAAGTLVSD